MFLQGIQRLQRGERGLAVVFRLENGEEAGSGLRQPGGFFRHDLAVVNLDFQREIAHAETIAQWRPMANQMWPTPFWAWAPVQKQGGQERAGVPIDTFGFFLAAELGNAGPTTQVPFDGNPFP